MRTLLKEWSLKTYLQSREAIRPLLLHSNTTIAEALEVFAQNNVSSAPVIDSARQDDETFSSYLVRTVQAAAFAVHFWLHDAQFSAAAAVPLEQTRVAFPLFRRASLTFRISFAPCCEARSCR